MVWDKRVVEKMDDCVGDFVVAFLFKTVVDGYRWAFAGVYGPNIDHTHNFLWDELASLCSIWDLPWCIGGDFKHHLVSE